MKQRPPGITNEEFKQLEKEVMALLNEYSKKYFVEWMLKPKPSMEEMAYAFFALTGGMRGILKKYFIEIPSKDKCYVNEAYVKIPYTLSRESVNAQKIKCQACEENRNVDICHIIPKKYVSRLPREIYTKLLFGTGNVVFLCPNHHRLFDRGMLLKSEWGKIDVKDKEPIVRDYFNTVLLQRQKNFWKGEKVSADVADEFVLITKTNPLNGWVNKYKIERILK